MKRSLSLHSAPRPQLVPRCSDDPAAQAELRQLIAQMAGIDTSHEDDCVRRFQAEGIMPNPATRDGAADAQCVLDWCASHALVDPFLAGAKAYSAQAHPPGVDRVDGNGVDLEFEAVPAAQLPFFSRVLSRCPEIKDIELPIPSTSDQATFLAEALACNDGLQRLQLDVRNGEPPDSTVLYQLFSYHLPRTTELAMVRIHITEKPTGDTDWMRALHHALSTHLKAESVQLILPVTDGAAARLMPAWKNAFPPVGELSFPGAAFNRQEVDTMVFAAENSTSLTRLDLGNTVLTSAQSEAIAAILWRNGNRKKWDCLTGS